MVSARAIIASEADEAVNAYVDAHEADGTGHWIDDPNVPHVTGFFVDDEARIIVYRESRDFETADDLI